MMGDASQPGTSKRPKQGPALEPDQGQDPALAAA